MCTALLSHDPGAEWPLLLAFVRDEERGRVTDPPGFWWPEQPGVFGGHDARAGGTWLAVDVRAGRAAFVQNQIGPHVTFPDAARSPSRGQLPLLALADPALELADLPQLEQYQPFHLVTAGLGEAPRWRQWSGSQLEQVGLQPGVHVIASRGIGMPGERERRASLLERLAGEPRPEPAPGMAPSDAWGAWIDVLDGRSAAPDDFTGLVVHSVAERPGFGTVGATLVALAADGRVRYDVNATTTLSPGSWSQADAESASVPSR